MSDISCNVLMRQISMIIIHNLHKTCVIWNQSNYLPLTMCLFFYDSNILIIWILQTPIFTLCSPNLTLNNCEFSAFDDVSLSYCIYSLSFVRELHFHPQIRFIIIRLSSYVDISIIVVFNRFSRFHVRETLVTIEI